MKNRKASGKELILGAYHTAHVDHFSVTLTREDVTCVLRRMELFRKYKVLDQNLHEMVYEGGFGGFFFAGNLLLHHDDRDSGISALEMVICTFDEADFNDLSAWCVREDGQLRRRKDCGNHIAVQWRGYHLASGAAWSDPLWEDELLAIQAGFSAC